MHEYGELPVMPGEETDLPTHVKACVYRFMALLKKMNEIDAKFVLMAQDEAIRRKRAAKVTALYRLVVITVLTGLLPLMLPALAKQFGWASWLS